MAALLVACLAAVLLVSSGCREKTARAEQGMQYAAQPAPVAACPTAACPTATATTATATTAGSAILDTPGATGRKMYVELANPQSDDQGNYVPLKKHVNYPLMGYASGPDRSR